MKAKLTVVYEFRGISRLEGKVNFNIPKTSNFTAKIVDSISDEFNLLGIKEALIEIYMGFFIGKSIPAESEEYFQNLVDEKNQKRMNEFTRGTFLVFQGEVDVPSPPKNRLKKVGNYIFALNAFPKNFITKKFQKDINYCLITILLSTNEISSFEIRKIGNMAFLTGSESPIPIYLLNVEATAKGVVGSSLDEEASKNVSRLLKKVREDDALESSLKLFLRSTMSENGEIKSFIDAWLALEKFVNKKFRGFYKNFWVNNSPQGLKDFVAETAEDYERIEKKQYNLRDKFLIMSAELKQKDAKKDYREFCEIQDLRGDIYHDRGFDEKSLPIDRMQKLFKKYLNLHLGKT